MKITSKLKVWLFRVFWRKRPFINFQFNQPIIKRWIFNNLKNALIRPLILPFSILGFFSFICFLFFIPTEFIPIVCGIIILLGLCIIYSFSRITLSDYIISTVLISVGCTVVTVVYYGFNQQSEQAGINWPQISIADYITLLRLYLFLQVLFSIGAFVLWQRYHLRQFVVKPIEVKGSSTPELESIAQRITHNTISHLYQIGNLISHQQIENANTIRIDTDAIELIMTGGFDISTQDQINLLESFELSTTSVSVPMGFINHILERLARFKLTGTLQQRDNNTLHFRVEITHRMRREPSVVNEIKLPRLSPGNFSDREIESFSRDIALKLAFELGGKNYIPDFKGFGEFLLGLSAISERKWWLAIKHYQRAIDVTQIMPNNPTDVLHYHLGAALVSQGNYEAGLENLQLAEKHGSKMPETYYMLALTLLYQNFYLLHQAEESFEQIRKYCQKAIKMKSDFTPARHLLGMAYYMLARLQEREATRQYGGIADRKFKRRQWQKNYKRAVLNFKNSARLYSWLHELETFKDDGNLNRHAELPTMLISIHQLADGLRGLGYYDAAAEYYLDVLDYRPHNLRTLVDLSKTYCLAREWEKAIDNHHKRLDGFESGRWEADANLYVGWAIIGQAASKNFFPISYNNKDYLKQDLFHFLKHIDYGLHQRPRFFTRWKQNDWQQQFEKGFFKRGQKSFDSFEIKESKEEFYYLGKGSNSFDVPHISTVVKQIVWWLRWRMVCHGYLRNTNYTKGNDFIYSFFISEKMPSPQEDEFLDCFLKLIIPNQADISIDIVPFKTFINDVCKPLIKLKGELADDFSTDLTEHVTAQPIQRIVAYDKQLQIAEKAFEVWQIANNLFATVTFPSEIRLGTRFFLVQRWALDVFAEVSLLTTRLMADVEAFETLTFVANQSQEKLTEWVDKWKKTHRINERSPDFKWSPFVFRYQHASLFAWTAYGQLKKRVDLPTQLRQNVINQIAPQQVVASNQVNSPTIESLVSHAFALMPEHPLAMFVHAHWLQQRERYDDAADILKKLLENVSPFDPSRTIAKFGARGKKSKEARSKVRSKLYHMERIAGRQQFEGIVNPASINLAFSKLYQEKKETDLSVSHLRDALATAPTESLRIKSSFDFTERLKELERFDESQAVLDTIRTPLSKSRQINLPSDSRFPSVMQCVINTRRGYFGESLEKARQIAREFEFIPYSSYDISIGSQEDQAFDNILRKTLAELKNHVDLFVNYHLNISLIDARSDLEKEIHGLLYQIIGGDTPYNLEREGALFPEIREESQSLQNKLYKVTKSWVWELDEIPLIFRELILEKGENTLPLSMRETIALSMFRASITRNLANTIYAKPVEIDVAPHTMKANVLAVILQKLYGDSIRSEGNGLDSSVFHRELFLSCRILLIVCQEAFDQMIHYVDICNTLAYNKAELDIRLDLAYQDVVQSIFFTRYFLNQMGGNPNEPYYNLMRQRLAQFSDSAGWIHYRANNSFVGPGQKPDLSLLVEAQMFLEMGLKYQPSRAIIHYHLARVHLTAMENSWQTLEVKQPAEIAHISPVISKHLRKSFRHWRSARDYDQVGRLFTKLTWLGYWIDTYKTAWDDMQLSSFLNLSNESKK